ncbi:uncharacterized protein [Hyperolius riggenbachi]|uniref:uncharacterized protein n=1 Tax=Hyperolius riggenbachi TaxID=752182 RepID=UPI0035A3AB9B
MASADLSEELECPVCLTIYTDPVNLRCGHNFCRVCIDRVLDSQEGSGVYSCPQCRKRFRDRPGLQTNIALRNIAGRFLSTQPDQGEAGVRCTYCVDSPVPAVMSCLHCDASLCDKHLRVHSKAPEHVLCAPTTSPETRKCSVHKKILEYYCTEDASCVCVTCTLAGEHRGHQVETLQEASEKKKKKLWNDLQKLRAETEEAEKRVQNLEELRRKAQEKADGEAERVTALFRDLRRRLEELEERVLSDITRQAQCYDDIIRQLEIKKAELSRKMRHIEELCHMTDPLTLLQESDTGDLCDTEDRHDKQLHDGGDLDVAGISHTLHTGLADIMSGVTGGIYIQPADILLDVTTASNYLHMSDDRKTASWSDIEQNRPETPERFQWPQVLSSRSFSSGRHYWEVDVGGSVCWVVGMCYPSIARRGWEESVIGWNNKSWGLCRGGNLYSVRHDRKVILLPDGIPSDRVRIDLDYEAGQISFYALCDPIRHLHTFTATFTEPLHAGLYVRGGCIKISGGSQGVRLISVTQRHMGVYMPPGHGDEAPARMKYTDGGSLPAGQVSALLISVTQRHIGVYMPPGHGDEVPVRMKHTDGGSLPAGQRLSLLFPVLLPAMASADLSEELECPVCLTIYTDPVSLRCGHNFCRVCIERVLDSQEGSAGYVCPQCRKRFRDWPGMQRNIALRNIEHFQTSHPDQEAGVHCTYCVDSPVPAVMSCLHCDASMCDKHLRVHSKAPEHVLCAPTTSPETRKCSVHKEILKYYCTEDAACVCVTCTLAGEHRGHQVETLQETPKKKKHKLRNDLQTLVAETEEASEKNKEKLRSDLCDTEDRHDKQLHDGGDLDVAGISHTLHTGLAEIMSGVTGGIYIQPADILLDVTTACNWLHISDDRKTASWSLWQNRPETPERFQHCPQVLSSRSFSSGRHYWEVDIGGSDEWRVGMCYPSIDRGGRNSGIGRNNKSWGLCRDKEEFSEIHDRLYSRYSVTHDGKEIELPDGIPSDRVRIYLDYEAGQISFYALCDPIRHLHTFTATFTEPLHAGLYVGICGGCIKISGGSERV